VQSDLFTELSNVTDKETHVDFDPIWLNFRLKHILGEFDFTLVGWYYIGQTCKITYEDDDGVERDEYFTPY